MKTWEIILTACLTFVVIVEFMIIVLKMKQIRVITTISLEEDYPENPNRCGTCRFKQPNGECYKAECFVGDTSEACEFYEVRE